MKITPNYTVKQIKDMVLKNARNLDNAVFFALQRIGEQFVADARNNGNYTDQTGNLRSSIGYVILLNGNQLSENFEGNSKGVQFAKRTVANIKGKYSRGYVLIGVAGMDYAAAVESKGFHVITGSANVAQEALKRAMERIKIKQSKL